MESCRSSDLASGRTHFPMKPLGYAWLVQHFKLATPPLRHRSFLGTRRFTREHLDGAVEEHYVGRYDPGEDPLDQLVFALKYDGLDLNILRAVLFKFSPERVAEFVSRAPNGKYARRIGCWYDLLVGSVPLGAEVTGSYIPLLDPADYVVSSKPVRIPKWRIANNAIGDRFFLPLIRRTPAIQAIVDTDWAEMIAATIRQVPETTLRRALSYFYTKETKSSFAIEREEPGASKAERFIALLHRAGIEERPLSEENLTRLQNAIVDQRFQENGFRDSQNYIGETTVNYEEIIHSIGTPPGFLRKVMGGLERYFAASADVHPILRAAAISFPFVFVHPFEDGNGRIHRYLLHDLMARGGIGGSGFLLPVSAEILADLKAYDACLEGFSKPLLSVAEYELDGQRRLTVTNPQEILGLYAFPDVTAQAEYLGSIIRQTIQRSLPDEIRFLERLDSARQAIQEIVDLPGRILDSLLIRLHRNQGSLARKRREGEFKMLTDQEIEEIEQAFRLAFELNGAPHQPG